ncbi:MAG: hypothetical protein OEO19_04005 [Gammaproteobacteria bacterium]|nr:hypothetical protein [Gammaproteobacteria bacterium]MDH3449538.1 hypothetical protein [Gammaproteobacteria bacterium]
MNEPVSSVGAGGDILFTSFNSGVFTVVCASLKIPDKIIDDLIGFLQDKEDLAREIANNRSQADAIIEVLLEEEAPGRDGLVCN